VPFDPLQYIASHDDLIDAFGASRELGERHYQAFGRVEGRAIDTFDEQQYLANYPDLAQAFQGNGVAATIHYIEVGKDEGRTDEEAGNTPPTAVDDTLTVTEDDGSTPVDVLANDSDLDAGDVLTVVAVSNAGTLGSVALGPGGAVAYDPGDAFVGLAEGEQDTDSFSYTVKDDRGGESRATVDITVTGANDAPVITSPAAISVAENNTATGLILAASDPEEDPVAFTITGGADADLFTVDAANQLVFTAAPDFEEPADANADNAYSVQVTADDGAGGTAVQDLTVTVTDDVSDNPAILGSGTAATATDFFM
jgi:VCBS repeat-containing protein